jgi:methylated-DNA-[protein]-cysteine S-methyltransferase
MPQPAETWRLERVAHSVVPLVVAADADDALVYVSFGSGTDSIERHAARHGARLLSGWRSTPSAAGRQLAEYLAGRRRVFDLRLRPLGTAFQRHVWAELAEIPWGQTRSYGQQAARIGRPAAARAVGRANGRNPLSIVLPCHRVVGADGSLTGFGGGLPTKRWLLEHEAAQVALRLD